jgi:cytochrome b561
VQRVLRNSATSWGSAAKTLHWLIAVLILAEMPLGWIAQSWRLSPLKLDLFVWHKSLGILILGLVALRLAWRWANPLPHPPASVPAWQIAAARIDHLLQYALMLALPLSGWVIDSAARIPFRVFRLFQLPPIVGPSEALEELGKVAHWSMAIALLVLVAGHTGAALWHHYARGDDLLRRMLPVGEDAA